MSKSIKHIHTAFTTISWTMLTISLVYLLTIWDTLPNVLGVHFAPGGEFDVYDSKIYIAYPYGVGFGLLFLLELACYVTKRVKSGLKITKSGELKLKVAVYIFIDIIKLSISCFFTHWADCVIKQKMTNRLVPVAAVYICAAGLVAIIIAVVVIRIKDRELS